MHQQRLLITLIMVMLLVAGCAVPGFDSDDDPEVTPVSTPGEVPSQPITDQGEDEPVVDQDDDGWITITGPSRMDSPPDRSSDDVLRMVGGTDPPVSLDPALVRDTSSAFLVRQLFRGLVRFNAEMEPVPDLAERIEIDPDARTYRFHLHDQITFHDGSPITAAAVKASMERAGDPALLGTGDVTLPARNYLEPIEGASERMAGERDDIPGIVVVDEHVLEINLTIPVVEFLGRLANATLYVVDVEQAASESEWWRTPNGSGPFKLEEWDPQRVIRLTPHDGYVRPPYLAEVQMRVGREAVGAVRLYENNEIDVVGISTSVVDRFDYPGAVPGGELRAVPMLSTTFVMMNPTIEPFTDERLRRALIYGFPSDKIADVMLDDKVRSATGVLPPEMDPESNREHVFPYDESQARALMNAIRMTTPFDRIQIYTSGGAIPGALKQIYDRYGMFEIEVVQLRWSDYLDDLDRREVPFFVLGWVADDPDPASFLHAPFHSDSPDNYAEFSNEDVDALLDQALIEHDAELRSELLIEAHQLILESAVVMPLYHGVDYMLVADYVDGLETTPMGILGLETVRVSR